MFGLDFRLFFLGEFLSVSALTLLFALSWYEFDHRPLPLDSRNTGLSRRVGVVGFFLLRHSKVPMAQCTRSLVTCFWSLKGAYIHKYEEKQENTLLSPKEPRIKKSGSSDLDGKGWN